MDKAVEHLHGNGNNNHNNLIESLKPMLLTMMMVKCLANELKRHIINVQLNNNMTKTQLESLFFDDLINVTQNGKTEQFSIPIDKRLFVFEDIDCECDIVFQRKEKDDTKSKDDIILELNQQIKDLTEMLNSDSNKRLIIKTPNIIEKDTNSNKSDKITLSFLLNLIDGILETPGRIIIMTTNFLNKLDTALIRPGRFDIIVNFTKCKVDMIIDMLTYYYDLDVLEEDYKNRILNLEDYIISPAELGKILFENFEDMPNAIQSLETLGQKYIEEKKQKLLESELEQIAQIEQIEQIEPAKQ